MITATEGFLGVCENGMCQRSSSRLIYYSVKNILPQQTSARSCLTCIIFSVVCLVFNGKIEETVTSTAHAGVYGGKAKSKRCVVKCFLKVATEMAERTDSGRLF